MLIGVAFFALMSSVFALRERSPTVPGTHDTLAELHAEIKKIDKQHHMAATFSGYRAIFPQVEKQKDAKYFLVRLDPVNRLVRVKGFKKTSLRKPIVFTLKQKKKSRRIRLFALC